jgi:hypothetical protein
MSANSLSKDNELYHYTGKGGLLGITKNKQLWASHILFLNDRSEFNLALEKTKDIVTKLRMGHKLKYKFGLDLQRNIPPLLDNNIEKEDAYIVSFSQGHDNLNMWKKYTDMSPGFCIAFDAAMLSDKNLKNDTIDSKGACHPHHI